MHRSSTSAARAVAWLLLVLATATACGGDDHVGARTVPRVPTPTSASSSVVSDPQRDARDEALEVLRDWDRQRAAAFVAGDPAALSALYVSGSGLARQDLRTLRGYQRRGVRVVELGSQVTSAKVLTVSAGVVELVVVERLGAVRVAVAGVHRTLPPSRFERRVLRFERVRGSWRLSSVRAG